MTLNETVDTERKNAMDNAMQIIEQAKPANAEEAARIIDNSGPQLGAPREYYKGQGDDISGDEVERRVLAERKKRQQAQQAQNRPVTASQYSQVNPEREALAQRVRAREQAKAEADRQEREDKAKRFEPTPSTTALDNKGNQVRRQVYGSKVRYTNDKTGQVWWKNIDADGNETDLEGGKPDSMLRQEAMNMGLSPSTLDNKGVDWKRIMQDKNAERMAKSIEHAKKIQNAQQLSIQKRNAIRNKLNLAVGDLFSVALSDLDSRIKDKETIASALANLQPGQVDKEAQVGRDKNGKFYAFGYVRKEALEEGNKRAAELGQKDSFKGVLARQYINKFGEAVGEPQIHVGYTKGGIVGTDEGHYLADPFTLHRVAGMIASSYKADNPSADDLEARKYAVAALGGRNPMNWDIPLTEQEKAQQAKDMLDSKSKADLEAAKAKGAADIMAAHARSQPGGTGASSGVNKDASSAYFKAREAAEKAADNAGILDPKERKEFITQFVTDWMDGWRNQTGQVIDGVNPGVEGNPAPTVGKGEFGKEWEGHLARLKKGVGKKVPTVKKPDGEVANPEGGETVAPQGGETVAPQGEGKDKPVEAPQYKEGNTEEVLVHNQKIADNEFKKAGGTYDGGSNYEINDYDYLSDDQKKVFQSKYDSNNPKDKNGAIAAQKAASKAKKEFEEVKKLAFAKIDEEVRRDQKYKYNKQLRDDEIRDRKKNWERLYDPTIKNILAPGTVFQKNNKKDFRELSEYYDAQRKVQAAEERKLRIKKRIDKEKIQDEKNTQNSKYDEGEFDKYVEDLLKEDNEQFVKEDDEKSKNIDVLNKKRSDERRDKNTSYRYNIIDEYEQNKQRGKTKIDGFEEQRIRDLKQFDEDTREL